MEAWLLAVSPLTDGVETTWATHTGTINAVWPLNRSFYVVPHESVTARQLESHPDITRVEAIQRYVSIHDWTLSDVLRVYTSPTTFQRVHFDVRDVIRGFLYTTDLSLMQEFCFETGLFPLCQADIIVSNGKLRRWALQDSPDAVEYDLPPLRTIFMDIAFKDVNLEDSHVRSVQFAEEGETWAIEADTEGSLIEETVATITALDPDVITTRNGDATFFHFAQSAIRCGLGHLSLSRNDHPLSRTRRKLHSTSYMTYGRIYHSYSPFYLYGGRFHFDLINTFLWSDGGLEGVADVARMSCMDVQKAARGTIGTALSAIQIKEAMRSGILIPTRKADVERFRSADTLLLSDRGGFIYSPEVGIHEDVIELDFQSMFPTIMVEHNISPETILCKCCSSGKGEKVPGTHYHTCAKREGIVPRSLRTILKKRAYYKAHKDIKKYDQRQKTLKWLLVGTFGYQGYRNARFGRIEAHEAINAWARDALLKLSHLTEKHGFEIIAGIVDSIWIKHPQYQTTEEMAYSLCEEAKDETGLPVNLEGIYKWIVFLSRRQEPEIGVLNRYYGVFRDGSLKYRGIELRRRDSCPLVKQAQWDMIGALKPANNIHQYQERLPKLWEVFHNYRMRLENGDVDLQDLMITTVLSKEPYEYVQACHQAIAAQKLAKIGAEIRSGMKISYLITDAYSKQPAARVIPKQLLQSSTSIGYDIQKYTELLRTATENLIPPVFQTKNQRQMTLKKFL